MSTTNIEQAALRPVATGDFLRMIEVMLELPQDTLAGTDTLANVAEWTSLAVIEFIALADDRFGVVPAIDRIAACTTFNELYALVAS